MISNLDLQATAWYLPRARLIPSVSPILLLSYLQAKPLPHTAWYQEYEAGAVISAGTGPGTPGRSFYSSLGHLNATWMDPIFMKHVMGGLAWTFGSNTTRVAKGLYGGAEPTIHTGASNTSPGSASSPWAPVLGSSATAPPPPPGSVVPTPSASAPASTGTAGSAEKNSGVMASVPTALWAVVAASLGAFFGVSTL